jgi:hypothetical protein
MSFKVSLVAWSEFKVERSIIYFSVVVGLTETFDAELYMATLRVSRNDPNRYTAYIHK